ncbi:MAG: NAD(P)-binding protein, partial [Acidobacteriota bacterium]
MDRSITRRDFLNGVALTCASPLVAPANAAALSPDRALQLPEQTPGYYPPALTGMRGSHAGSFEVAHRLRDARSWPEAATDTGESYDLVIVGGGISGLAAAHYFKAAVGPSASILVLDNHDDFGGHAKRNEFRDGDRMFMLNGGTLNIEAPLQYSDVSMNLLRGIGLDLDRFEQTTAHDRGLYQRMGLRNGMFFPQERFGADRLVVGTPGGAQGGAAQWAAFLAKTPLADQAKQDIARWQSDDQPDYMPGLSDAEKKRRLMHM